MAFSGNYLCTSFKVEVLKGVHDFTASTGDTFKMALYDNNASFTAATTAYTATDEISGTGYTAGGVTLTNVTPVAIGTTAVVDFANAEWTSATFSGVRGALIYNDTAAGDPAVAVLDFGADYSVTSGTFTVSFPTVDAESAIVRIT